MQSFMNVLVNCSKNFTKIVIKSFSLNKFRPPIDSTSKILKTDQKILKQFHGNIHKKVHEKNVGIVFLFYFTFFQKFLQKFRKELILKFRQSFFNGFDQNFLMEFGLQKHLKMPLKPCSKL